GIGETPRERADTLVAIRDAHERYGHIQEVIVQNFRAKPRIPMRDAPEPSLDDLLRTLAVARLVLGPDVNIQAPPNLSPHAYPRLLAAGLNDWGGISPLTLHHINPEKPWPLIPELRRATEAQGIALTRVEGRDLHALTLVADELRRQQAGDVVTYVVNRNINFTNVCIKHCTFCAFSRDHREEEGYFLPVAEVVRRAQEARELGATEVCIQAGLPPKLDGRYYIDLARAITTALPELHIHAFSPEEVLYGSVRSGLPIREYLSELKAAGLGTLPGTSAE